MACSKCAQKAKNAQKLFLMNKSLPVSSGVQEPCVYTVEELEVKLQGATLQEDWNQVGVLKSALNMYSKSCNMFNNFIK